MDSPVLESRKQQSITGTIMTDLEFVVPDFSTVRYPVNVVADMLNVSVPSIKKYEKDMGLEVERQSTGVQSRRYSLENIFDIASHRRTSGLIKPLNRPITLTVHVKKGGVAKTTLAVNLAIQLSLAGYKTLLVDNDPQGDATSMLSFDPDLSVAELEEMGHPASRAVELHFGHLFKFGGAFSGHDLKDVIKKPFGENGLHLIPADESLDDLNVALTNANNSDFRFGLLIEQSRKGKLKNCDLSGYDFIIFDCPPSSTVAARNALVACDYIVTPVRMDRLSVKGLSRLTQSLSVFEEDYNRAPTPIVVPTMFQKNRPRTQRNLAMLMQHFNTRVTDVRLHHSEDYPKAMDEGYPVSIWKGASPAIRNEFRDLATEIIQRITADVGER